MTATVPVKPLKKGTKGFLCCALDVVCLVDMVKEGNGASVPSTYHDTT